MFVDIIFSSKLAGFLREKEEQLMFADKYPSIFSRQMEALCFLNSSLEKDEGRGEGGQNDALMVIPNYLSSDDNISMM